MPDDRTRFMLNEPCGVLKCPPGWTREREVSLRLHDAELWLVRGGQGLMRTRTASLPLRAGFGALMRPGGIYDAEHDEANPLQITYIHFDVFLGKKRRTLPWCRGFPEFFEIEDLDYLDAATRRVVYLSSHDPEAGAALLKGVLADIASGARRERKGMQIPMGGPIAQVIAAIRADPGPLPSVREMARRVSLSPEHFSRVFRRFHGSTAQEFLLQTRLSRARSLLRETNLRVGEISDLLGYRDVFFFSRQFKAKTGLTPTAYRAGIK